MTENEMNAECAEETVPTADAAVEEESVDEDVAAPDSVPEAEAEPVAEEEPVSESPADEEPDSPQVAEAVTEPEPAPSLAPLPVAKVPQWPYAVVGVLWVTLAGLTIWQLTTTHLDVPTYKHPYYAYGLIAGLTLVVFGPGVALLAWVLSIRSGVVHSRLWLFVSALVRAGAVTLAGALLWYGALVVVDFIRLGTVW